MNILKMFFRSEAQMSVDVIETWEVRWHSRYDSYSQSVRPEVRAFPSKEDAKAFAKALNDAFRIIKHSSGNRVDVNKVN